jgi:hypothetical protein
LSHVGEKEAADSPGSRMPFGSVVVCFGTMPSMTAETGETLQLSQVYVNPLGITSVPLLPLEWFLTSTWTAPRTVDAGVSHVNVPEVPLMPEKSQPVPALPPKDTVIGVLRFVPVNVTVVPPSIGPKLGEMLLMTGRCGFTANAVPLPSSSARAAMGASLCRNWCRGFILCSSVRQRASPLGAIQIKLPLYYAGLAMLWLELAYYIRTSCAVK